MKAYRDGGGTRAKGLRPPLIRILKVLMPVDDERPFKRCAGLLEAAKAGNHSEYLESLLQLGFVEVKRLEIDEGYSETVYRITAAGIKALASSDTI